MLAGWATCQGSNPPEDEGPLAESPFEPELKPFEPDEKPLEPEEMPLEPELKPEPEEEKPGREQKKLKIVGNC